jgi:nucleotide-binding universal stress UspA family protein
MSIIVGVSPRSGSPNALRWASEEAKLRGTTLEAVMAWRPPRAPGAPGGRPPATVASIASDDYAGEAMLALRGFVTEALGDGADVECHVVRGSAASALLSSAGRAQLLVLGEPRPGRLSGVKSSLLAPQLVLKARCPVLVLPSRGQ